MTVTSDARSPAPAMVRLEHSLKRQLLLDQAKEAERLGRMLKETDEQLKQMEEGYERLRDRLDHKDAQRRNK